ncbi:MAG: acyl-CoA carboxylase subunit beta [Pseudonocardiales bacterium]|nr:acyl-CoA carboxylase subunit beta [Pseudonocardiales bacterium]MBV9032256.1 acyl-CoA carboxylase subunit beta [Pseudonocardiales bacterium]
MTALATSPDSEVRTLDPRDPEVRVAALLDAGTVAPLRHADSSGVYAVRGRIDGAQVIVYCTDATKMGGALSATGCRHIVEAIDVAIRERCPVIGLWHSGGARLSEGVEALDAVGHVFNAMIRASGRIPQISVVLGPAAGGAAYGPALTDVVIMTPTGRVFVTGPEVVRSVTGEQIDQEDLGGVDAHSRKSGVVHILAESEADAYARARRITGLFARPGLFDLHAVREEKNLRALLPEQPQRAYDIKPVIAGVVDADSNGVSMFEELQAKWAPNIVVGLGRLGGRTIGIVANNPIRKGGCLDSLSAEKASRFVRTCDSFGVPLLVLVDVPGYLPGAGQEWSGIVRRGAKLLYAFAEAVVPRVTLVLRKSYGGAYIAMNARSLGATAVFAWPEAEVAVMDAKAAVGILHRKKLAAAPEDERGVLHASLVAEQERVAGGVSRAISIGVVDQVIDPPKTRQILAETLAAALAGRGSHGNIPL